MFTPDELRDDSNESQDFYYLPLDGYGQPSGFVQEISQEDYLHMKELGVPFLYTDYWQAVARAMD